MSFKVIATPLFKREAKRLLKRYVSLKIELAEAEKSFQINPVQGTPLGHNVYKFVLQLKVKAEAKAEVRE